LACPFPVSTGVTVFFIVNGPPVAGAYPEGTEETTLGSPPLGDCTSEAGTTGTSPDRVKGTSEYSDTPPDGKASATSSEASWDTPPCGKASATSSEASWDTPPCGKASATPSESELASFCPLAGKPIKKISKNKRRWFILPILMRINLLIFLYQFLT